MNNYSPNFKFVIFMTKEVRTSFYLPENVLFEVKERALKEKTSMKEIMNRYIIDGLNRDKNQSKLEVEQ